MLPFQTTSRNGIQVFEADCPTGNQDKLFRISYDDQNQMFVLETFEGNSSSIGALISTSTNTSIMPLVMACNEIYFSEQLNVF